METRIHQLIRLLASSWMFVATTALFTAEAGRLALTGRFPGAFDEAFHLGLIQLFAHRLNPVLTSQTSDMYRFGPLVHNPPFLYHYLMSFPYRLLAFFTDSVTVQIICLRFINIALVVASLIVLRKFLRLMCVSDALANVLILAFALTPLTAVVASQINYDNLLILAGAVCMYIALAFMQQFDKGRFDTKKLLILLCLCLFASLIKFAFLPAFAAIAIAIAWKLIIRRRAAGGLKMKARRDFAGIPKRMKLVLLMGLALGSLLFAWFYLVNVAEYHSPAPQCDQIRSVRDCEHYYAYHNNYALQKYHETHPAANSLNALQYGAYWFMSNTFQLFGAQVPLQGSLYIPTPYLMIVSLLGAASFACTAVNFKKMLKQNPDLSLSIIASLLYLACLWARNYQDYLRVGEPTFIHGRYLLPVLLYTYLVLASGVRNALQGTRLPGLAAKTVLALAVVFSFVYYGGIRSYVSYVEPVYGQLSPSDDFILRDAVTGH